jgi:3-deoxy-D-manno-octulosonate 8-phosphate phosphatase (KDO 8-P phosphatase)
VQDRLEKLGVEEVHMKVKDKKMLLEQLSMTENVPLEDMLYMGDDMPDYEAMQIVGIAACPSDACYDIKNIASYIALAKGGEGCAREVIEKVLKLNGHWDLVDHIQAK